MRSMPKNTIKLMREYAQSLPPSSARVQCYTIAGYKLDEGETIAQRIERDHVSDSHAKRSILLMAKAGAAIEIDKNPSYYGTFVFEDGSEF